MTLLSIIQDACDRIGIPQPSAVVTSADQQIITLLAYAQQEGIELSRRATWQKLTKEVTFTSIASETQTAVIPADFDRFVPETFYNRTRKREVLGPLSPQEWQAQKGITATVLFDSFRIRGGNFLLLPTPPAGDTYAFEYVSNQWCESAGGTDQSAWAADSDVGLLDEEVMTLGVVWRFKKGKGFDYGEDFRSYELQADQAIARDGAKRKLNFSAENKYDRPRYPGIPEGTWNLS